MLGPGNDSGDPDAVLVAGYDALMSHISASLTGAVLLPVTTEGGDPALFFWKYGHAKPSVANAAVDDDPLTRLGAIFGAVECAAVVAEGEGLTVA